MTASARTIRLFLTAGTAACALLAAQTAGAQAVGAQTAEKAPAAADAAVNTAADTETSTELQGVILTGSRSASRTVDSSPAPIDVLSEAAVERANKSNLLENLNSLLPSYNVATASNNVSNMVRAGQLRGLTPDQTLVLVNGRRHHSTAFLGAGGFSASAPVDLSMIASGAIKRIEVLRDGASALYGSDAIAGVINLITDNSDEGGDASVRVGQYYKGDGLNRQVQLSQGIKLGQTGHLRLSGELDDQRIVIRNSPINPNLLFYFPISTITGLPVVPAGTLSSNPSLPANAVPDPREATRNNNAWINQGKSPFSLLAFSADFGASLTDTIEGYGFATYATRHASAPQNFRTPNRDEVVRAIYPDGYTPVEEIDEVDMSLITGIRGVAGKWDWDLSSSVGRDTIDVGVSNSLNPTYGLASQTSFYIGRHEFTAWTKNLDLRRSFQVGVPIDFSVGVEQRDEHYTLSPGDVQSYTNGGVPILDGPRAGTVLGNSLGVSQALPGYSPTDAQDVRRHNLSFYTGVTAHLTPKWVVDIAGRAEDFSDFGRTQTGRLSSRYDFTDAFSVRGTISNGFHAPALAALSYKATGNANTQTNYTLAVSSPQAVALGAKPLTPETSTNYSLGLVAKPWGGITLAVDAYQIEVDDRITQSTQFNNTTYPGSGALVVAAGFGINDGISYFINAVDTRTKGLEITLEKTWASDRFGVFRGSYAANFNKLEVTRVAPTPAVLAAYNIPVFSQGNIVNLQNQTPKSKHILGLNWSKGRWNIDGHETFYGALTRSGNPNPVPVSGPYAGQTTIYYDIGALWITDLSISYDLAEKTRLTFSVNNLFNVKPDLLPAPLLTAYQTYSYATSGPIGAEGGFYSLTLKHKW
jgi:iron complex outermembrane receptor protein